MFQEMTRKTAEKMSGHSIIEFKAIHIYAYGLELLFSSLAGVVCGKYITHRTSDTSATKQAVHYYYNPYTGLNDARCDYSYYTVTEADVCAAGHNTNITTTRHEFNHGCMNVGR